MIPVLEENPTNDTDGTWDYIKQILSLIGQIILSTGSWIVKNPMAFLGLIGLWFIATYILSQVRTKVLTEGLSIQVLSVFEPQQGAVKKTIQCRMFDGAFERPRIQPR